MGLAEAEFQSAVRPVANPSPSPQCLAVLVVGSRHSCVGSACA